MNWDARIESGESCRDIEARFMPFIHRLEDEHRGTDANVLLISHGGTLRAMLPLLLSNVDHAFALDRGFEYTTCIVAELIGSQWVCLRWGGEACKTES
jgi:broad specificity phosphatase PhoE